MKRKTDLNNPDSIRYLIAMQRGWSQGRKRNAVKAYDLYTKMNGIKWTKPKYKPVDKLPFIPTEQEMDSLIGGCCKQMSAFLQVLKETGAHRGEAFQLKWEDIDFVSNRLRITPLKGSRARIFKISDKLLRMIHNLPKNRQQIWNYKNLFYLK